jgi:uncharacterized repeat protein (TIGR01451 family)
MSLIQNFFPIQEVGVFSLLRNPKVIMLFAPNKKLGQFFLFSFFCSLFFICGVATTVLADPDLSIAKSHIGDFTLNILGTYTLTVTNHQSASSTIGVITVTDTLPTGLNYVNATGSGWTCGAVIRVVTCTNPGPLVPSASSAITLSVNPAIAGNLTNIANVTTANDTDSSNDNATDPTQVNATPQPDLAISKTHSGNFTIGTNGVYTITVTNVGAASTTGTITVTDTLPIGMSYVSAAGSGWSCSAANQVVTCTSSTVLAASLSSSITLTVNPSVADGLTNIAAVSVTGDQNAANNIARDPTTVIASSQPDLAIAKTHSGSFTVGVNGTYFITVTNIGTANATGTITVTDTLPVGLTFVSASGAGWTCGAANQVITCTISGPMAPASNRTITLTVLPSVAGTLTNIASVSGTGDNNAANNTASDSTLVNAAAQPDLEISKSHIGNFTNGATGSYSLTVTNIGTAGTTGTISVTDTMPTGMTYVSASGTGWTCGAQNQTVTCTNPGPLAPSGASTISLTVAVNASGNLTNIATVATAGDTNTANDTATDPTTINASLQPDLSISKTHSGSFTVGTPASYSITVTNVGSASTSGLITVTDTLPLGLAFASGNGTGWTCNALNQTVTCTNADPLAPTANTVIAIDVNPVTAGDWTNLATVETSGDTNFANDTATDPTLINASPQPDLAISKSHTGDFTVGSTGSYTLSITNIGAAPTTNTITLVDTLPIGLNYLTGSGTGWSCSATGQVVSCSNATPLAIGATTTVTITVDVDLSGGLTNIATVSTAGDTNNVNNYAIDPTIVMPADAVRLHATMRADLLTTLITYTVRITNTGTHQQADNPGNEFVSPIPPGTTYLAAQSHASAGTLNYDSANRRIRWNGAIASGGTVTVTFVMDAVGLLAKMDETPLKTADFTPLIIFGWAFGFILSVLPLLWKRHRRTMACAVLLVAVGWMSNGCTLFSWRHAIICNQGQIYYDSDSNGNNDSVILTDDPRMPVSGAPTCL